MDGVRSDARSDAEAWPRERMTRWIAGFLVLGVLARLVRYTLRFPLWEDEAFLAYNLMTRDFRGLLEPLDYIQVAPIGYLYLQKLTTLVLGFNEYSLRFWSILLGLGGLFVFARIARRLSDGWARVFAVGLFAVSYPMIRYSAEAKQYGFDLAFTLVAVWAFLEWRAKPERRRWPALLAATFAFGPWFSFPSAFVAGALALLGGLALVRPADGRRATRSDVAFWAAACLLLCGSFFGNLQLCQPPRSSDVGEAMHAFWGHTFPDLRRPASLPGWLLATHAGDFLAYPLGSPSGGSSLTLVGVLLGIWSWSRRGERGRLALALVPIGLHFLAAALHRYPYGGHVKYGLYWGPFTVLLAAAGIAEGLYWFRAGRVRTTVGRIGLSAAALIAVGVIVRDVARPAKTLSDLRARDFARWFWFESPHNAVTLCLDADLGKCFTPNRHRWLNWSASFACNRMIYSERHRRGESAAPLSASDPRLVRVVEFRPGDTPYDAAARERWLSEMNATHALRATMSYPCTRYDKFERTLRTVDFLDVYEFVPRR